MIALGASAGGLEAYTRLLSAKPGKTGMAFILVQHLEPTHDSMIVELLVAQTEMVVVEAAEGMPVCPDHLYVIPPGFTLSVSGGPSGGTLHIAKLTERHGARLPFDTLLQSMAAAYGPRAICVVLSGTGTDGTLGLAAVKAAGGMVIVQRPEEAAYSGMPDSAVATGKADRILLVSEMPACFRADADRLSAAAVPENNGTAENIGPKNTEPNNTGPENTVPKNTGPTSSGADRAIGGKPMTENELAGIIGLLRERTGYDFSSYKLGTVQRRVERRMAMAAADIPAAGHYLELLRRDPAELLSLSQDLLINVTSFFRDPKVFETLQRDIIPGLIGGQKRGGNLRIWIAGCSSGEETYSIAMLCREQLVAAQSDVKLQIFASDIDTAAVARARAGLYPKTIETDISAARLARFFVQEDGGFRVAPELRAFVVFTVQDVLQDPPFSRLDLISCRNLLIYLLPKAQAQVLSVFHFALRDGGVLLLGGAETAGNTNGRFEPISKTDRIYRRIGHSRPGEIAFLRSAAESHASPAADAAPHGVSRQTSYAELGRRLVLEHFAPAAILVDHDLDCLFSLGPTDRFLRVAPGYPSLNLLGMARPGLRTKLNEAAKSALAKNAAVTIDGGRIVQDGECSAFSVNVRPVHHAGEALLLICFTETKAAAAQSTAGEREVDAASRIADLELELDATRGELEGAVRDLATSSEDQKAINEEALSVNEEYQSTNEELLTSKEELQSLNEELIAVNAQLQETLERQRTTSNDLQNVLYSTDIATIFLDPDGRIRFFTPATKSVFNILPGDIGRPLSDLHSLVPDDDLAADLTRVLHGEGAVEQEIQASTGTWFCRRVMPYLGRDGKNQGTVMTFTDVTDRKAIRLALEAAQRGSEAANAAKTRFLAAASHDLRQPLQTLSLLQGLLGRSVEGAKKKKLVALFDETLGAMSGMLSTLLDINQIDAGVIQPEFALIDLAALIEGLREEFSYHAEAQGLSFRVMVAAGVMVRSDPRLLAQILRNLISNAFKYTRHGKVLLGCRRRGPVISIQIWDTGIGIADLEIHAIFEEYHQVDNQARERSRGVGLGLPIVQRLARLLGHEIHVRSRPGSGSMFSIDVAIAHEEAVVPPSAVALAGEPGGTGRHRSGTILLVEDDQSVCQLLDLFLRDEGHRVLIERDGVDALALLARTGAEPDLILSDYNLPNKLSGLQFAAAARKVLNRDVPVIILTGDISTSTVQRVSSQNCHYMVKPVKLPKLAVAIQTYLPAVEITFRPRSIAGDAAPGSRPQTVFVIDDDRHILDALCAVIREDGRDAEGFPDAEAFMAAYTPGREGCLLVDAALPGMSGLDLIHKLRGMNENIPVVMVTGTSDVRLAIEAMRAGAADFIEKPIKYTGLLKIVDQALERSHDAAKLSTWHDEAASHINALTARQHQIMELVLAGHPSKNIAADLNISQRTVENHRAAIMKRTGSASLPALARLAVTAALQAERDAG